MPPAVLLRLVAQVRRRVVLGSLLAVLVWAWVVALALSALWVVVQRLAWPTAPDWVCVAVPAALLLAATALAFVFALLRAPSPLGAAMSLDQRFGLRERVTTSLTLDPETAATPAGQALLADAEERARTVRVAERFPVTVPWKPAAALPLCCGGFVLLALLFHPSFASKTDEEDAETQEPLAASKAVEEQMKKLAQVKPVKKGEEQPKAADLKRIEAEIEKFVKKPRDKRDEIQERIKDATAIEEELERKQKEEAKREQALRDALKQAAERLKKKHKGKDQEGAGKDAKDALARGDMQKSADELRRLAQNLEREQEKERLKKKLKDPNLKDEERKELEKELDKLEKEGKGLDEKEKEEMAKQLEEMEEMLERLARKEEDLKKDLDDLKKKEMEEQDPDRKKELQQEREELERELEQMQQEPLTEEEKKELQELAEQLKECKECMGKGKEGEAGKKMAAAAKKMGQMGKEGDKAERARMLARMQAARRALSRQMQQGGPGGPAAGKRPEAKDETGEEEKLVRGEWEKGKVQVVGQGPKGGKKFDGPRKASELKEEIRAASQEATSAIDRQRLPPSARKMTRDYFERMRDKDKEGGKDGK